MQNTQEQEVKTNRGENIYIVGAKVKGQDHEGTIDEFVREEELSEFITTYKDAINSLFKGEERFQCIAKVKKIDYKKIDSPYVLTSSIKFILDGLDETAIADMLDTHIREYFRNPDEETNKALETKCYTIINQFEVIEKMIKEYVNELYKFADAMRYIRQRDDEKTVLPS